MSPSTLSQAPSKVVYPDDDGQPMSDNTLQFQWIVTIKEGLDDLFRDDPNVFVAGDLLWYPVEGDPKTRAAPDAMVAFGRPKGYRGSYKQWEEEGIAPQVVFEVLSPGNRFGEMLRKFQFYERFGVDEYYIYDPDHHRFEGWLRDSASLREVEAAELANWTSPRLGIRFVLDDDRLTILRPDGRPFLTYVELARERDQLAEQRDQLAEQRDQLAEQRDAAVEEARRLAEKLRALGVDTSG